MSGLPEKCGRARRFATNASSNALTSSDGCCPARRSVTRVSCTSTGPGCGRCPTTVPDLVGPAVTPQTAARHAAGRTALVSVNQSMETQQKVLDSYREAGGRGPARLQIHLSWAATDDEALAIAHDQWRSNVFAPPACWDVETVETFDVISEDVSPEQVRKSVNVSSDLGKHAAWLQSYVDQGWDELYLHFVGQTQAAIHRRIR